MRKLKSFTAILDLIHLLSILRLRKQMTMVKVGYPKQQTAVLMSIENKPRHDLWKATVERFHDASQPFFSPCALSKYA
jgi:hypothetical protein